MSLTMPMLSDLRQVLWITVRSTLREQEKTGRDTGRREAEPPEVAQITETVVPLRPWK